MTEAKTFIEAEDIIREALFQLETEGLIVISENEDMTFDCAPGKTPADWAKRLNELLDGRVNLDVRQN